MKLSAPLRCGTAALAAAVIGPFAQAGTIHVPADAPSLSAAIALAQDGDEIVVADGTWKGPANRDLEIEGKDLVVRSENGAAQCIIDCEHKARALYLDDCGPDTIIEGLTIRHGQVGTGSYTTGQGMYIAGGAPVVRDCVFDANGLTYYGIDDYGPNGGGIALWESAATIEDCRFTGNLAAFGGAIYAIGGSLTVRRCNFEDNVGMAHFSPGIPTGGFWEGDGGALNLVGGTDVLIADSVFDDNHTILRGGAIMVSKPFGQPSTGRITHCTFVRSTTSDPASFEGQVIYAGGGSPGALWTMDHVIVWANSTTNDPVYGPATALVATWCDVQGGFAGAGNMAVDPQFVNLASGDLRLAPGSPCIDVGPHGAVPYGGFTDLDHASRLLDGDLDGDLALDMGAYERTNVALKVGGIASPGSTLTLDVSGTAGLQYAVAVGASLADPPPLVGGFGYAVVSLAHPWRIVVGPGAIPATATLTIPTSAPSGSTFFLQPLAWASAPHAGNFGAPATITLP